MHRPHAQDANEAALKAAHRAAAESQGKTEHAVQEIESQRAAFQTQLAQLSSQVTSRPVDHFHALDICPLAHTSADKPPVMCHPVSRLQSQPRCWGKLDWSIDRL